jgi:ABC-type glycerol-3-phosphate transport system substrate-binding protein
MKTKTLLAAFAAATLLAACGGGGGDPAPVAASDAVPASASQSDAGLMAWLKALVAGDAQGKEPLDMSSFQPTAADDSEPVALD